MTSRTITSDEARARAEQRFAKANERARESEAAVKAEEESRRAVAAKVERLRAMRLAKEAVVATPDQIEADAEAERQRADLLAMGKPPAPPKVKRPRKTKASTAKDSDAALN
jgi:alkanesulfonate monooxygenase SsuD/methylene tetrahydromethanopterin reductase-like flavin-dependent oxidoreductase (luciferase family)